MSDRNEKLRALLQKGDPAAGEPELTVEEVRAMRRAVLTAVPEPRRRRIFVPALATVALLLAVVIFFSLWRLGTVEVASKPSPPLPPSPTSPTPSLGEGGSVAKERVAVPLSRGGVRPAEGRWGRGDRGEGPRQPAPAPPTPAPPAPDPPAPESVIAEGPQQIQFSTPGGTRVIWMLNPATD